MQSNHLNHLARATAGIDNTSQFILAGTAALLKPLGNCSELFKSMFDEMDIAQVVVADNIDPEGLAELLNTMMGKNSAFYSHYGYGINAVLSWEMRLPTNWVRRIVAVNGNLRHTPSILTVAPTDVVLGNMIQNTEQELNLELVKSGIVEISELRKRTENWENISAQERMSVYAQTQELEALTASKDYKEAFLPYIEPFKTESYTVSEKDQGKILSFKRARPQVHRT